MNWILLGGAAFILLTLFDLNKVYKWHSSFNALFPLSIFLLILSLVMIYIKMEQYTFFASNPLFYILVCLGALEQVYALFFALPKETYTKLNEVKLVDSGLYSLCRHPGVWGFIVMAFGFTLASGSMLVLWTALSWTLLDLIHVAIQDRYIFPKSIPGYTLYQVNVPFLFFKRKESTCQNLF